MLPKRQNRYLLKIILLLLVSFIVFVAVKDFKPEVSVVEKEIAHENS